MNVTRKIVGSTVTEADLNALNYLVAQYIELTDNINLSKTNYKGEYGSYYLDSTVNDDYTGTCKVHYNTNLNGVTFILHLTWYNNNNETTTTTTIGADGLITVTAPTGYTRFDNNATIKIQNGGNENNTGYNITFTCDNPIIEADDTSTVTAIVKKDNTVQAGVPLRYTIKHGNTLISSGSGLTNTNGQITINYTGTSVGAVNILVYYGTLLQETYELIDAIYYDNATSDKSSNYYFNPSGGTTLTYSNGYYVLGLGTSGNYVQLGSITDNVKSKTVNFDVDFVLDGASTRTEVYVDNTRVAYSPYSTTNSTLSIQNVSIPSNATSVFFRISRRYTDDGDSIKFKNFKIYPI